MLRWLPKSLQNAIRRYFIAPAYARSTRVRPIAPDDKAPRSGQERHFRLEIAYDAFCEHRPPPRKLFRAHPKRRDLTSWCDRPNAWTGRRKPRCHACAKAHGLYIAARDKADWKAEVKLYAIARYGAVRLDAERRQYRAERRPLNAAIRKERARNPNPMPAHFQPDLWEKWYQHRGSPEDWHHRDRREVERALVKAYIRNLRRRTQNKRERKRDRELALERASVAPQATQKTEHADAQPDAPASIRISQAIPDSIRPGPIRIGGAWRLPLPKLRDRFGERDTSTFAPFNVIARSPAELGNEAILPDCAVRKERPCLTPPTVAIDTVGAQSDPRPDRWSGSGEDRMASRTLVLLGTRKGVFILDGDAERRDWNLRGPFCNAWPINHAIGDPRTGTIYAAGGNAWFGPAVWRSDDLGATWTHSSDGLAYPEGETPVTSAWSLAARNGTLFAGVEPAGLFRSEDGGRSWSHVAGLREHPSRPEWQPGAGGLILHAIVPHPHDNEQMWVAISAAGVFHTQDGGASWAPRNSGTRCDFNPPEKRYPEFGQCVHALAMAAGRPERLYQQNHCGMYRSDDGARTWESIETGLPSSFGFPAVPHPRDPDTLYLVPLNGDLAGRFVPEGKAAVWRTRDAGARWEDLRVGLPQRNVFFGVLRQAMAADTLAPTGIYFGTNTGELYASADEGDTWTCLAQHLPPDFLRGDADSAGLNVTGKPKVAVTLPAALAALFPGCPDRHTVSAETVHGAITELDRAWPGLRDRLCDSSPAIRRHIRIFVAGEPAALDTPLRQGDEVFVLTAISGG